MNIIFEKDKITAYDSQEKEIGYLNYYEFKDSQLNNVLIIDSVESYLQNQGVFRTMLNSLLKHANHKRKNYLLLEINIENQNAIGIYKHYGFYETTDEKIISSKDFQTRWMRYDLD